MRQALLLLLGVFAISYLEFEYYPGHTYLAGESQNTIAMLERLDAPGFLSRDLVATNPNLTDTVYDEVTLFLHRASTRSWEQVLGAQQLLFRFAGVLGVLLLSLAAGLRAWPAIAVTAVVCAISADLEPTPSAFAWSLELLAFGLLARGKPLLSGVCGGLALAYQPITGAVYWLTIVGSFFAAPSLRSLVRATLPSLLVFGLLLANAAQLQPGIGESQPLFERMSNSWLQIQLQRTPGRLVTSWPPGALLLYLLCCAIGVYALRCLWPTLSILVRCVFAGPILGAVLGIAIASLLAALHSSLLTVLQPARMYLPLFVFGCILAVQLWNRNQKRTAALMMAVLAGLIVRHAPWQSQPNKADVRSMMQIAAWAGQNTWGGSMFAFPDLGRSDLPGYFRGLAVRAVYVDWNGGALVAQYPAFAETWHQRWQQTAGKSAGSILTLPIDYLVLRKTNAIGGRKPEFTTPEFLVYDTTALRR